MKKSITLLCVLVALFLGTAAGVASAFDLESKGIEELKAMKYLPDQILVKFRKGESEVVRAKVHRTLGALKVTDSYGKFYQVVTVPEGRVEAMVRAYQRNPHVEYAEPDYLRFANMIPDDPLYISQWSFPQINLPAAWNRSSGAGVTVAVVDTGVNPDGEDSFGGRVIMGQSFVRTAKNSSDDNGHGTHVAGTVGQETNNQTGCAGIAFDATILAVKVLNKRGVGFSSGIVDGIRWAADNGADVMNFSFGSSTSSLTEEEAINYAHGKDVVICAASGNDGTNTVGYPAAYENCIAVGSTRYDRHRAPYSNYGAELDVVAPGGDTSVDQNSDGNPDGILQETFMKRFRSYAWDYYYFQGTSMATPHVSGVAALIRSLHPAFTADQVRQAIENSAQDLGPQGWDAEFGWGLVDADASLGR